MQQKPKSVKNPSLMIFLKMNTDSFATLLKCNFLGIIFVRKIVDVIF